MPKVSDILFVNPPVGDYPYPHLPLGLAELKAFIDKKGFAAGVYDAWAQDRSGTGLRQFLALHPARTVGITITSFTLDEAKGIAETVKKALPEATIVAGGPHPSYDPENFLTFNPGFDAVIFGEGEETLAEYLAAPSRPETLARITGLAFRRPGGGILVNQPRTSRLDLDALPFPDFRSFPLEHYLPHAPYGRRRPFFNLITSRGCPYQCVFCSNCVFGQRVRFKSAERVFAEVEWLRKEFGAREIHFYDDVFSVNRSRVEEFCRRMLGLKNRPIWSCTTRVDMVDEKLLRLMKSAGCWLVTFGVESGSDPVLSRAGKNYSTEQIKNAFGLARRVGLRTHAFFMVGLPGDTRESIGQTIRFAQQLRPGSSHWATLLAIPGSRIFEEYRKGDREHRAVPYDKGLPAVELEQFRKKAIQAFFFSPRYMVQVLFSIRSLYEFKNILSSALRLLKAVARHTRRV